MFSIDVLTDLIMQWGEDRKIIQNGQPIGQVTKTIEEAAELLAAVVDKDEVEIKDAIGDVYVTLCMVAATSGVSINESIQQAYDEIKDRKGILLESGIFIKDE
jgi:phosphoribosyl-ATP pyrophosphohydrolase